jgi:hypothetical protein
MSFSTDTTLSFTSDTGYVLSNTEISGGELLLTSMSTSGTCETPDIDVSTWVITQRFEVTHTLLLDTAILFIVSFDSGDNWWIFDNGVWRVIEEDAIATVGMSVDVLESIRSWVIAEDTIRFKIYLSRVSTSSDVSVDLITGYYKTSDVRETYSVPLEPAANETLESALGIQPEYPIQMRYRFPVTVSDMSSYTQNIATDITPRRVFSGEFQSANDTDRDAIVDFLNNHVTIPFTWVNCPLTSSSTKKFYTRGVSSKNIKPVSIIRIPFEFTEAL